MEGKRYIEVSYFGDIQVPPVLPWKPKMLATVDVGLSTRADLKPRTRSVI